MNQDTLFILLILLAIFEATPDRFRARWKKQQPLISAVEMALNNQSDFMNLTTYSLQVFKNYVIDPVKPILQYPRYQIRQWLHTGDLSVFHPPPNGRKPELSVEDRMMRCVMFNRNCKVKLLEILWGQKKSIIHEDVWLIMQVIAKIVEDKFKLPLRGSNEYRLRVGAGTLADAFANGVHIMDGHEVKFVEEIN